MLTVQLLNNSRSQRVRWLNYWEAELAGGGMVFRDMINPARVGDER